MHVRDIQNKEVLLLKRQLKTAQSVSKAVWSYRDYVEQIKEYIALEQLTGAQELFEEIPYPMQKLLMTAPTKGGVFTTQERAIMKTLWSVKIEDIEQ